MMMNSTIKTCWIFCTVIDNFGDIGVSWRLANQLHHELGWRISLWLDDETALRALCPDLPALPCVYQNIALYRWQAADIIDMPSETPQIVIETFGCDLPENIVNIIKQNKALWLNWEYLSAEAWASAMHGKASLFSDGIKKYFWLMGFDEQSGGLLREKNQPLCHDNNAFRCRLKLPDKTAPEWLLFGYHSEKWAQWLAMWQQAGKAITLLLAGNQIIESLEKSAAIPKNILQKEGDIFQTASVKLIKIPFVAQNEFDHLLYLTDGIIIRGEDSFVRAQFTGKPFFWHIYPQDEQAHLEKLTAFWQRVYPLFPVNLAQAHWALSQDLNDGISLSSQQRLQAWQVLQNQQCAWQDVSQQWRHQLCQQSSAIERLYRWLENH